MNTEIIVCLISLFGTIVGSLAGIMTSNKLTTYRIGQLEQKVDKHNNLIDRMYKIEKEVALQGEKLKDIEEMIAK